MIWESEYWKDDLLSKAKDLRKRVTQKRWSQASFGRLEQTLMLGFYGIRKLHEASVLANATMTMKVPITTYPWSGKNVTKLNWHKINKLYSLESGKTETQEVLFLCHQFVHSYVFMACFDENNQLEGILLASDHQRHKSLLSISITEIINLFEHVGTDYPNSVHSTLNPKTGDYDIISETRRG